VQTCIPQASVQSEYIGLEAASYCLLADSEHLLRQQELWTSSGSPSGPEVDVSGRVWMVSGSSAQACPLADVCGHLHVCLHSKHLGRNCAEISSSSFCVFFSLLWEGDAPYLKHIILIALKGGKTMRLVSISQLSFVLGSFSEQQPGTDITLKGFTAIREFWMAVVKWMHLTSFILLLYRNVEATPEVVIISLYSYRCFSKLASWIIFWF